RRCPWRKYEQYQGADGTNRVHPPDRHSQSRGCEQCRRSPASKYAISRSTACRLGYRCSTTRARRTRNDHQMRPAEFRHQIIQIEGPRKTPNGTAVMLVIDAFLLSLSIAT